MESKLEVAVVGAGQAGLALSYFLKKAGIAHAVFDRAERIADSWYRRWDAMQMITPNWMNHLPGLDYPGEPNTLATREDTIRFLEAYSAKVDPPLRLGVGVTKVEPKDGGFVLQTSKGTETARQVVIAAGPFQAGKVPSFAGQLDSSVKQMHSSEYKRPTQFPEGSTVVVVGTGNSGVQIAYDLAPTHKVTLAQGSNPKLPRRCNGKVFQMIVTRMGGPDLGLDNECQVRDEDILWWFKRAGLWDMPVTTPVGSKMALNDSDAYLGPPLPETAAARGVTLSERVTGVEGKQLVLKDGSKIAADGVVWATGFKRDFSFVDAPIFDSEGRPRHARGVVAEVPGLYFLGLRWQWSFSSDRILGVPRDAEYLFEKIKTHAAP